MKIRNGFVSNSSSSSFVLVGVDGYSWSYYLWDKEGLPKTDNWEELEEYCIGNGGFKGKNLQFWGGPVQEAISGVGFSARSYLEDRTLKQAREDFQKWVKETHGLDIPLDEIDLIIGESSSEY